MRILQLISSAGFYGAEASLLALSEELREQGHEVIVASLLHPKRRNRDLHDAAVARGLHAMLFSSKGQFDLSTGRKIRKYVRDQRIDIVHTHGYKADVFAYICLRGLVPLVSTCHGWPTPAFKMQCYAKLDRRVLRAFNRVVAVSDDVVRLLKDSGVAEEKIRLIRNGVSATKFNLGRMNAVRHRVRIGVIGRIVREKGSEVMLRAFSSMAGIVPNADLIYVGEGPLRLDLQEQAIYENLDGRVQFAGFCHDMPALYATLDIVALPSFYEGMPMVVLESMAAGVPLVTSAVGEIPKVVQDGRTGILVRAGDVQQLSSALTRLACDEQMRAEIGTAARRHVLTHYDISAVCAQYVDNYQELCGVKAAPSRELVGEPR